jgi:hypothetical protein
LRHDKETLPGVIDVLVFFPGSSFIYYLFYILHFHELSFLA